MPGQQADFAIQGSRYEKAAENVLCEILTLVKVPREIDFGIDFFCSVLGKSSNRAQTTLDFFGLQTGGLGKTLAYGGIKDGKPKEYEIDWLKSLTIPLLYARVSTDRERVHLYSMSAVWRVFFRSPAAFEIECEFQDPSDELFFQGPEPVPAAQENATGDGNLWRINLGPPILSRTAKEIQDPQIRDEAVRILRYWLQRDWTTVVRFQTNIALADYVMSWSTNNLNTTVPAQRMYWSPVPGPTCVS